jgi:hypothetical protein
MKANGGALDSVIFAVKTDNQADLDYLDELLKERSCYSKFMTPKQSENTNIHTRSVAPEVNKFQHDWWSSRWGNFDGWGSSWGAVSEPDSIYIKMDDDIVSS